MEIPIERVEDEEVGWYWSADATAIFGNSIKGHSYKNLNVKGSRFIISKHHFYTGLKLEPNLTSWPIHLTPDINLII